MRWKLVKILVNTGPGAPILYEVADEVSFDQAPDESDVLRVVRPFFKCGTYLHVVQLNDDRWCILARGYDIRMEMTTRDICGQNVWPFELHACLHRYRRRLRRLRDPEAQLARALLVLLLRRMSPWRLTMAMRQALNYAVYNLASALRVRNKIPRCCLLQKALPWLQRAAEELNGGQI